MVNFDDLGTLFCKRVVTRLTVLYFSATQHLQQGHSHYDYTLPM